METSMRQQISQTFFKHIHFFDKGNVQKEDGNLAIDIKCWLSKNFPLINYEMTEFQLINCGPCDVIYKATQSILALFPTLT